MPRLATWHSAAEAILCCPLLSQVPDLTVAVSPAAYFPGEQVASPAATRGACSETTAAAAKKAVARASRRPLLLELLRAIEKTMELFCARVSCLCGEKQATRTGEQEKRSARDERAPDGSPTSAAQTKFLQKTD